MLGNAVTVTGSPNQEVPITLPVLGNVGTVHINEQTTTGTAPSTTITVNAVRIELDVDVVLVGGCRARCHPRPVGVRRDR